MIYNDDPEHYRKGASPLASGRGLNQMLDISKTNRWTEENTILEVKNPNDLDSKWTIWRKVQK